MNIIPRKFKEKIILILICFFFFKYNSQTKIISSSFSSYNVSPESMCGINISNNSGDVSITIESKITNIQGAVLIKSSSNPLTIKNGVFNSLQLGLKIANTTYQSSSVSEFVRLYHQLPSGKYNYCVSIKLNDGSDDELCEDIESENSSFLTLINPIDKDTIETPNPVLIWNHSESFNLLQQGEYYRLMLTEIKAEQNSESALNVNSPLLLQNFLSKHDVLYAFDAPKLNPGGRYAWQVQKVVNGVITNKTEAWEFVYSNKDSEKEKYYVEITPKLNTQPYLVKNNKIYFLFKEEYYSSSPKLKGSIIDDKGKSYKLLIQNDSEVKGKEILKSNGSNYYELLIDDLKLKKGYYTLQLLNEKNQEFLLKFYLPN